jgi:hypothetical protein
MGILLMPATGLSFAFCLTWIYGMIGIFNAKRPEILRIRGT